LRKSKEIVRATRATDCNGAPIPGPFLMLKLKYSLERGKNG
jgi:hypothetical protein